MASIIGMGPRLEPAQRNWPPVSHKIEIQAKERIRVSNLSQLQIKLKFDLKKKNLWEILTTLASEMIFFI